MPVAMKVAVITSINDAKFAALRGQGFTGAQPDMTLAWLQANGAVSDNINDAWQEMLLAKIATPPGTSYQRNDFWLHLLGEQGYTGQLNDRALAFWEAGGVFL